MKAVFGAVVLRVEKCRLCGDRSIVLDGLLQCCLVPPLVETKRMYRGCAAVFKRRRPTELEKRVILARQENRCAYCRASFGDVASRGEIRRVLQPCWDHVQPFCWQADSRPINFVVACSVCNGVKSSKMFETLEEARSYVWRTRKKRGWEAATEQAPPASGLPKL